PRWDEILIDHAAQFGPAASIWSAPKGLVVPRGYRRFPQLAPVSEHYASLGWPVTIRQSGGGIVPQGPGILNLSLAYAIDGPPLAHSDAAYEAICEIMRRALEGFGIQTHARAVEGSFCDGRYNLAVGPDDEARKVAGTAQVWRRKPTPDRPHRQVVLVHGLLLATVDTAAVTAIANEFEAQLGNDRRYLPQRVASLHTLYRGGEDFIEHLRQALIEAIQGYHVC